MKDPQTSRPHAVTTISIGNSHVSMFQWDDEGQPFSICPNMPRQIAQLAASLARGKVEVLIAGVVPRLKKQLHKLLKQKRCRVATFRTDIVPEIEIVPDPPEKVGDDRIASALGALTLDATVPWIVADLGTAVTCNAVTPAVGSKLPRFEGGLIAPGLLMSLKALSAQTAQLPDLAESADDASEQHFIGRNTEEAMRWGVNVAQIAALLAMIEGQRAILGPRAKIALTGGGAAAMMDALRQSPHSSLAIQYQPHLVQLGLGAAWRAAKLRR
jgi:pantothenate kinase type III